MKPYLVVSIVVFLQMTVLRFPHVFPVQFFVCCSYHGEMNHIREIGIRPFQTCTWYQSAKTHCNCRWSHDPILKWKPCISSKVRKIQIWDPFWYFHWINRFRLSNTFANTFAETTSHCSGFIDSFRILKVVSGFHTPITSKAMMPNTAGAAATPGQSHERGGWRL